MQHQTIMQLYMLGYLGSPARNHITFWQLSFCFISFLGCLWTFTFHQSALARSYTFTFHQSALAQSYTFTFHQSALARSYTFTFHQSALAQSYTFTFHQSALAQSYTFTFHQSGLAQSYTAPPVLLSSHPEPPAHSYLYIHTGIHFTKATESVSFRNYCMWIFLFMGSFTWLNFSSESNSYHKTSLSMSFGCWHFSGIPFFCCILQFIQ